MRRAERTAQLRDWALLSIALAFVAAGMLIWPRNPEAAVVTIVLFGPCAIVPLLSMRRRRRRRVRVSPANAWTLPSDRTLRPQRGPIALTCAGVLFGALIILAHSTAYPWLFRTLIAVIGMLSAGVLVAVACGRAPRGFIRFDAAALSLGRARYTLHIPWRAIQIAASTEIMNHPALVISLLDPSAVTTSPAAEHARAVRELATLPSS